MLVGFAASSRTLRQAPQTLYKTVVHNMREIVLIIVSVVLISCNPFNEKRVLDYKTELTELTSKIDKYDNGSYDRDEIDEFIIGDVRDLDIDLIVKNNGMKNPNYLNMIMTKNKPIWTNLSSITLHSNKNA